MSENPINQCERCSKTYAPDWLTWIVTVRPGGHTLPSFSVDPVTHPIPPSTQKVCYGCLTDFEMLEMLRPVLVWIITAEINQLAQTERGMEVIPALEMVRTMYMVLNLNPPRNYRGAAIKALRGMSKIDEEISAG